MFPWCLLDVGMRIPLLGVGYQRHDFVVEPSMDFDQLQTVMPMIVFV